MYYKTLGGLLMIARKKYLQGIYNVRVTRSASACQEITRNYGGEGIIGNYVRSLLFSVLSS
ncbi:hypothetical protein BABINDRAFT_161901 [Babjeviella inositovora NRRL Y-12698]|uniref:Uncharacterized protein n=1 Tax=Babjeviella inositovora NRRL Y-12698 TaxID=984486 RepID=A0A1E3QPD7_9ASCO|nr:uncharacterized protein BABINDRAFT_161901 [Babjeviella inositovora NRRL Y-12698]ODQ79508.1 hypothetical protein BABINDRAFT_161901 [Babjeviella inositovora NRRL Y-12698]